MLSLVLLLIHLIPFYFLGRLRSFFLRRPKSIAFFHPYCNAGGGGERVLWRAISAIQQSLKKDWKCIIYTEDCNAADEEIIAKAQERFDITVDGSSIQFVRLRCCWLIEPKGFCTMFLQLFGGLWLGMEALWRFTPAIFVDSTGVPLTLPVFKIVGGAKVACYVHYPTITKEMVELVRARTATYNNRNWIANFYFFTLGKMLYYYDLATLYAFCGAHSSDLVMTNGSWTNAHIRELWGRGAGVVPPIVVYPPCDVDALGRLNPSTVDGDGRSAVANEAERIFADEKRVQILSVGQIRPEKNHELQLAAFAEARRLVQQEEGDDFRLVLIVAGGCRNSEDRARLRNLRRIASEEYGLADELDVKWRVNIPFPTLLDLFRSSLIGIHTMWNEHFGISVVEGLAAGNIMVAHNSAGPKLDIIGGYTPSNANNDEPCGFLAETKEEYARRIADIVGESSAWRTRVRANARDAARRFSNAQFDRRLMAALRPLIDQCE